MLQVKHLVKRYTTKGETVTALSDVSVDFPERGMVFLLGKSGSGKSTLLNLSGGLDSPDEGEIVVKGRSSKDFSESDFDSYRNTYVGFIFQEYNILNARWRRMWRSPSNCRESRRTGLSSRNCLKRSI